MAEPTTDTIEEPYSTGEDFGELLEEFFQTAQPLEGAVLKGTILSIENDVVIVEVGLKSAGRIALKEFFGPDGNTEIEVGDEVDVYLERYEDRNGETVLSREKARREEAWTNLEKAFKDAEKVEGTIFGRVKGGFTVDLSGAVAFLPGSQVDIRPVRDIGPLMGSPQPFQILKMDRSRGNIVVSRRAVLEETRAEARSDLISGLKEGQILEGIVKNITDYGAFIDLGGVDGLLHITDISWRRINHPSEALNIGQTINVQVIRFNAETQRISLGMKQLEADPWEDVIAKYPVGEKFKGRVTNITDYGAFVELEPGIEALVHISEMSWTKKNIHPGKIVSTSEEVEVTVLDVDPQKRRISLGLKQSIDNPWQGFVDNYALGSEIEGEIKNVTEFGLFVGLPGDIDGMVHMSDLDWVRPGEEAINDFKKGDTVKVKVLDVDVEKERVSLGIKQLGEDPFEGKGKQVKKGDIVTCTVASIKDRGIEVDVGGIPGFIRKADLARDRSEQRTDRFAVGEKVDAKITSIDRTTRKINLSIKAREIEEEKQAMAQYGSSDSGASLGDILGAALGRISGGGDKAEDKAKKAKAEDTSDDKAKKAKAEDTSDDKAKKAKADEAPAKEAKDTATEASEAPEADNDGETEDEKSSDAESDAAADDNKAGA